MDLFHRSQQFEHDLQQRRWGKGGIEKATCLDLRILKCMYFLWILYYKIPFGFCHSFCLSRTVSGVEGLVLPAFSAHFQREGFLKVK